MQDKLEYPDHKIEAKTTKSFDIRILNFLFDG